LNEIPIGLLFGTLVILLAISGFFSGSETGLMSLNRYRLRHMARSGHRSAQLAEQLLQRPERLIGLILLWNNFVNILASAIATVLAIRLLGEAGIAVATVLLTLVVLIFSEVTPKTLAALHPERIAFPASWVLAPLLKAFYPLVWVVNMLASGILWPLGVRTRDHNAHSLNQEELRSVVLESSTMIPPRHRAMLLGVLDLGGETVEGIMIPRSEVVGINIDDDWKTIRTKLMESPYSKLPVYSESIDNVIGVLHLREVLNLLIGAEEHSKEDIRNLVQEPYFIPESTPLHVQLRNFQQQRLRLALVVDEYGDLTGLVTLEDILEEIVGEFTTDPSDFYKDIRRQSDGSCLVDGSATIREINRTLSWELPTDGPRTINGLIMEYLEAIPEHGASLVVAHHPVEIVKTRDNVVRVARIWPAQRARTSSADDESRE